MGHLNPLGTDRKIESQPLWLNSPWLHIAKSGLNLASGQSVPFLTFPDQVVQIVITPKQKIMLTRKQWVSCMRKQRTAIINLEQQATQWLKCGSVNGSSLCIIVKAKTRFRPPIKTS